MTESLFIFLQNAIIPLGAVGVFIASVAEEVIAPIPSALVMMTSGFLFVSGPVSIVNILRLIFFVAIPAALGVTLGSLWVYGVAWWGGRLSLEKFGKWIGLSWNDVEAMGDKFNTSKRDEIAIIGARVIPLVPSVAISAFCGFIRMNFWQYILLTFVGMFFRALVMGAIGWQVGNVYVKYAGVVSKYESVGLVIIAAIIIVVICGAFLRKRKQS